MACPSASRSAAPQGWTQCGRRALAGPVQATLRRPQPSLLYDNRRRERVQSSGAIFLSFLCVCFRTCTQCVRVNVWISLTCVPRAACETGAGRDGLQPHLGLGRLAQGSRRGCVRGLRRPRLVRRRAVPEPVPVRVRQRRGPRAASAAGPRRRPVPNHARHGRGGAQNDARPRRLAA